MVGFVDVGVFLMKGWPAVHSRGGGRFTVSPFSLSGTFGLTEGNVYRFRVGPDTAVGGELGTGFIRDSVSLVISYSGSIGRCTVSGVEMVQFVSLTKTQRTPPSDTLDTTLTYFDGTYYTDWRTDPYRILKVGATVGDTYQAWDTCAVPLNTKFPLGDVDGDGVSDTGIIYGATANLLSRTVASLTVPVNGSPRTFTGELYEVGINFFANVILTNPNAPPLNADLDSLRVHRYWRYRIFDSLYVILAQVDSLRDTLFFKLDGVPGTYPTSTDTPYVKELDSVFMVNVSIEEAATESTTRIVAVYDVQGRKVPAISRRGVYFVVDGRGRVRKVIRY